MSGGSERVAAGVMAAPPQRAGEVRPPRLHEATARRGVAPYPSDRCRECGRASSIGGASCTVDLAPGGLSMDLGAHRNAKNGRRIAR
jgi:hypothetical protein